ncbi:MAG: PAS domain S-box protein, partial [Victivallales bacterium]|nr:PAS domain S-box protein [Victivallales bacterium]
MTDESHPKTTDIPDLGQVPADIIPENLEFLKGLIESFNSSTSRLREAYKALQGKVDNLDLQLEKTNSDLSDSLDDQERLSNYLTNILESLSSGVLVIDIDGNISLFNRGAEEMTGVSVGDAVGKSYRKIMVDSVPDELTPLWTLSTGRGHTQIEKSVTSSSGKTTPVGSSISALRNSSGDMIGAVEIFMDLTRIKALEEELTRKEKLAALGQMAATMAHKIRNPLGGIAGFAGLLDLELRDSENGRRLVGKITEGVDKLDRIITSLLAYTSQLKLDTQIVDLNDIAEDCVKSAITGFGADGIVFHQSNDPVMVKADTERFRESLLSIIRNAVEAA